MESADQHSMAMSRLFAYDTLMCKDIMQAASGYRLPRTAWHFEQSAEFGYFKTLLHHQTRNIKIQHDQSLQQ